LSHKRFWEYVGTAEALEEEMAAMYKEMQDDMENMRTGKRPSAFKVSGPE